MLEFTEAWPVPCTCSAFQARRAAAVGLEDDQGALSRAPAAPPAGVLPVGNAVEGELRSRSGSDKRPRLMRSRQQNGMFFKAGDSSSPAGPNLRVVRRTLTPSRWVYFRGLTCELYSKLVQDFKIQAALWDSRVPPATRCPVASLALRLRVSWN